jgi:hypothetical protein
MTTRHRSHDADVASAGRIIAALEREAARRRGTPQADAWKSMASLLRRRWPQPPVTVVPDEEDQS